MRVKISETEIFENENQAVEKDNYVDQIVRETVIQNILNIGIFLFGSQKKVIRV